MRALTPCLMLLSLCLGVCSPVTQAEQQQIEQFVEMMHTKHQFDPQFVRQQLAKANKDQAVLDAIARPWEAKPWHQYYPIFLTEKRLSKGLEFWRTHRQTLAKAEQQYGVPAQIIVAIIGVETFYGSYKGKYPVLDALYTLGFYYPPRGKFFKSELEQYFLLTKEEGFAMEELHGSYAGAMGWGQFISSSYRHYAVDFDGDGQRDLLNNPLDAIGSVANYFARHGWKKDQPVAFKASISEPAEVEDLVSKSLQYQHTWQQLQQAGVSLPDGPQLDPQQSVKLLGFAQPQATEYWVGLPNFYSITRYNHSPLYAMVVYQFSQQLQAEMAQ